MFGPKVWLLVVLGSLCLDRDAKAAGAGVDTPRTGFIDRVYKGADAYEAKYVVFIPHDYDGKKEFPLILFLHGSGAKGTDGRNQIKVGLGQAIKRQEKTFAFIGVFPQSREGGWEASSKEGKRALAILDEVQKDYKVDMKRLFLTGISMGGDGTWSLAAAYPRRWAAIVPICGGGDPKTAPKIKDIPCWCFHGDADKIYKVGRARVMIKALADAGGRPLYHEYPGVGHNCWERAYATPDLYEWLLEQKLSR